MSDDSNKEPENGVDKILNRLSNDLNRLAKNAEKPKGNVQDLFFRAVKSNKADKVKKLLAEGADVNAYDVTGRTALHIAASANAAEAAKILIEANADISKGKQDDPAHTPLVDAVAFNKPEMVEILVRHGGYAPWMKIGGLSILHMACQNGKHLAAEALLKAGADPNETSENGSTPLIIAVKQGQPQLVELLLGIAAVVEEMNDHFVKTDEKKRTAFRIAIDYGRLEVVAAMIKKGANVNELNSDGKPPLLRAIEENKPDMVRFLAENGADLNCVYDKFGTPLMHACYSTDLLDDQALSKMIGVLIDLGADPDVTSPAYWGKTPLDVIATVRNSEETLRILLRYPIDKEKTDDNGSTALIGVARGGKAENLRLLLEAGANPNGRNTKDASTALIAAVKNFATENARILLEWGANPALYDGHGKSALSYARENKDKEMIALLEETLSFRRARKAPRKPGDL